jgi:hypothetical protein
VKANSLWEAKYLGPVYSVLLFITFYVYLSGSNISGMRFHISTQLNITDSCPRAIDLTVGRSKALAELADVVPFLYLIGLGSECGNNKISFLRSED